MTALSISAAPPAPARRRSVRLLPALAAGGLLALLLAPAPITGEQPAVWVCGESVKVRPESRPEAGNSAWDGRSVRLHAARQEYVGFQVVVRSGSRSLDGVEVRLSALTGPEGATLGAENVDLYRQHFLRVTVPSQFDNDTPVPEAAAGEYPVQMVPLRPGMPGTTFAVASGRAQPVWVDLYVPEGQTPGRYRGEVRVTAGGAEIASAPVELEVWRFTLPRETHLKTFLPTGPENLRWAFRLGREDRVLRELEDRFFQMAHQHRLNFHPSAGEPVEEEWGGRYREYLEGTAFRDRAGVGAGLSLLVVGIGGDTREEIQAHARKVRDWWTRRGRRPDLAVYVYDEPQEDAEFATAAARAAWIRAAVGRDLPLFLTTTRPQRLPPGLIDIWGEAPAAQVPERQAAGEKIWATNQGYAAGPYVDTPGYAGRSQAWMAWKMGLDAWYFWDACYWTDRQNIRDASGGRLSYRTLNADPAAFLTPTWTEPLTFDQKRNPRMRDWIRINGDGVLFYPGEPVGLREPLAGFTMKSLRRGLQDYEYLWLLRRAGRPADDVVERVVPGPERWARDPAAWDAARLELGRRLDALEAAR